MPHTVSTRDFFGCLSSWPSSSRIHQLASPASVNFTAYNSWCIDCDLQFIILTCYLWKNKILLRQESQMSSWCLQCSCIPAIYCSSWCCQINWITIFPSLKGFTTQHFLWSYGRIFVITYYNSFLIVFTMTPTGNSRWTITELDDNVE